MNTSPFDTSSTMSGGFITQRCERDAAVNETKRAINEACRSRGGPYAQYSCKTVSWDDASRGKVNGSLSCWGSNITDTYLKSKNGQRLFTVRPDNFNEKLGAISSSEVALVAGNHVHGGQLQPVTLRDFLKNAGSYGAYAGLPDGADLSDESLDSKCSIRFQTTFLPVDDSKRANLEFCTSAYNYNTQSDRDPRNLILLSTTQGVAVQADGAGEKKLFHHDVDHLGKINRHYLEAERSDHRVGAAQTESAAEKADALARGKATASVIGIRSMGTRFNVLMTVQVPLKQKAKPRGGNGFSFGPTAGGCSFGSANLSVPPPSYGFGGAMPLNSAAFGVTKSLNLSACPQMQIMEENMQSLSSFGGFGGFGGHRQRRSAPKTRGTSNAARVSRGSKHDVWSGMRLDEDPTRHPDEHITVTVVIYNTCAGGVPTEADVCAAIDDMEALYASCTDTGRLSTNKFDFMTKELTVKDAMDIGNKVSTQPPPPASGLVQSFNVFPTNGSAVQTVPPFVPTAVVVPTAAPLVQVPTPSLVNAAAPRLFQPSSTRAPASVRDLAAKLSLTHESFLQLHDNCGLNALNKAKAGTGSVDDAFGVFLLANDFHLQLHGVPSGSAMYNCSCSLAIAARDAHDPTVILGAQGLPPGANPTEAALDAAVTWLKSAVAAGYSDVANVELDPDLSLLRERRPAVVSWVRAVTQL